LGWRTKLLDPQNKLRQTKCNPVFLWENRRESTTKKWGKQWLRKKQKKQLKQNARQRKKQKNLHAKSPSVAKALRIGAVVLLGRFDLSFIPGVLKPAAELNSLEQARKHRLVKEYSTLSAVQSQKQCQRLEFSRMRPRYFPRSA